MKRTILTTAAFAAVLFIGVSAQASTTFTGATDSDWDDATNWDSGVPTAADNAVIPAGKTCDVNIVGAVADTVEVYGTLNIQDDMKLTLDGSTSSTSYVSGMGRIYLEDTTSELSFTSNNHVVTYVSSPGEIVGESNTAVVRVASGISLTNEISISGSLEIRADSGTFTNSWVVRADHTTASTDDTLTCYSGTFNGSGTYRVCESGSVLQFASGITATSLATDFEVTAGTLDINEDVSTTGDLTFTSGTIDVANGETFSFNQ